MSYSAYPYRPLSIQIPVYHSCNSLSEVTSTVLSVYDLYAFVYVVGTCECSNGPSGSIKCGEFIDWLRTCSHERLCSMELVGW
jgi:hypothetical protein